MEIMCCLNEIGVMICKLKDEKKLDHCDKKVKDLHSYLKRKKKSRPKTMRKSIKSKSISDVFSIPDKPLLDDMDKSVLSPTVSPSMSSSMSPSMSPPMHPTSHSTPHSAQHSIPSPPVNELSESQSLSESGSYEPTGTKYSKDSGPSNVYTSKYDSLKLDN